MPRLSSTASAYNTTAHTNAAYCRSVPEFSDPPRFVSAAAMLVSRISSLVVWWRNGRTSSTVLREDESNEGERYCNSKEVADARVSQ